MIQDTRIPSSLQGKKDNQEYRNTDFFSDDKPTRERPPSRPHASSFGGNGPIVGKENQRKTINIDESEDTFHNKDELSKILARGQRLRQQMDQALDADVAWEALHGPHAVPKKYVPPFLQNQPTEQQDQMDRIFELELDTHDAKEAEKEAQKSQQKEEDDFMVKPRNDGPTGHVSEMKFIKVKIISLRVENEELLHQLIDQTFSLSMEVPLPDIYQKKLTIQSLKLSNYDVVSFNEFAYNNTSLYNFKVDETTFNQLVSAQLKVSLDGQSVTGSLGMIKLLMSKNYKHEIAIPLEKQVKLGDDFLAQAQPVALKDPKKKDPKVKPKGKDNEKKPALPAKGVINPNQVYSSVVGHLKIELSLQRGEAEEEIAKEYHIKLEKLREQKEKDDQAKNAEIMKYKYFSMQNEPTFASLYVSINQIKNMCLDSDGNIVQNHGEEYSNPFKRNLFVQYKAYPGLEKLRTDVATQKVDPKFHYRSQFPIIVNPGTLEKLQNFTFVLEVWDNIHTSKEEFIGLVKIPLASFVYSMKTTDTQIYSLNFLADQHCLYPMMIADGAHPIYSPKHGVNVGELYITMALGSPSQVNRQIQKEQDFEKQQEDNDNKDKIVSILSTQNQAAMQSGSFPMQIPPYIQGQLINQKPPSPLNSNKPSSNPLKRQDAHHFDKEEKKGSNVQDAMGKNLLQATVQKQHQAAKDLEANLKQQADKQYIGSQLSNFMSNNGGETPPIPHDENKDDELVNKIGNFLRQSLNGGISGNRGDTDLRKLSFLNCLRKLFEEARASEFQNINGQSELFKEMPKNYDGSIKKEDFIYAILSTKSFTLTRTEIANISALLITTTSVQTPKGQDQNNIDLEELQRSYRSYLIYYDKIESRIKDLMEKFNLSITKRITDRDEQDAFIQQLEDAAIENKVSLIELKNIFDNNGITINDYIFDQLASYFDLDRNGKIYINSFCEYMRNPRMKNFNFFKVHHSIVLSLVSEYIKNEVQQYRETLEQFENDLKLEFFQKQSSAFSQLTGNQGISGEADSISDEILVQERISAKLFQQMMNKYHVKLTFWEVFTLFEELNTNYSQMYYEPQRYHQITFPPFYKFIRGNDFIAKMRENNLQRELNAKLSQMNASFEQKQREYEEKKLKLLEDQKMLENQENPLNESQDNAFDLAAELNPGAINGGGTQPVTTPQSRIVSNNQGGKKPFPGNLLPSQISQPSNQINTVVPSTPAQNIRKINGKKPKLEKDSNGIYSSKSDNEDVVINKKRSKRDRRHRKEEMTFARGDQVNFQVDNEESCSLTDEEDLSEDEGISQIENKRKKDLLDDRPFKKAKHIFEIQVKELKNIPILDKLIKDVQSAENSKILHASKLTQQQNGSKYIQNVAVKYSFPLDEDEIFQSDFIQLNSEVLQDMHQFDYKVSINTVHNYVMNKDDQIQKLLNTSQSNGAASLFNISLVIYDNNKEFVIGNAQLPIEDLIDLVDNYQSQIKSNILPNKQQTMSRVVFIYGTTFSQRENCIIGKMLVEINYQLEKVQVALKGSKKQDGRDTPLLDLPSLTEDALDNNPACFLHRETFIKRKIPLNAVLSVEIERISNLKESLENIEHFSRIQSSALREEKKQGNLTRQNTSMLNRDHNDRRRTLTQIFKQGLNIVVIGSIFDEDLDLKGRFPGSKYTSRILFNTLTPIFNDGFELGIQMDTSIFEYLKNKKAVFEIRHYIIEKKDLEETGKVTSDGKSRSNMSQHSLYTQNADENEQSDFMNENDYIVLGYVRVPLLHLITKNNGIDGDFVIFDEYKQQMGSLKLRIALNHHSSKRPLYSESNKVPSQTQDVRASTMIDKTVMLTQSLMRNHKAQNYESQYLLGLNFVELMTKNSDTSFILNDEHSNTLMYLKFQFLGQTYQTKFLSSPQHNQGFLRSIGIQVFPIKKTVFLELDLLNQASIEGGFSKPLEIQLWLKRENPSKKYQQPEVEQMLGAFFIELNELGKIKNRRVKEQNGVVQSFEGYFSLYDYQREQVVSDRLGCKVIMIKKQYPSQLSDLEVLFHNFSSIDQSLAQKLDPQNKGYADFDDIMEIVSQKLQDPYQSLLKQYIASACEYKSSDKIFYSALLGETMPPFFKYASRFDSFSVIEKFNKELQSIDTHGSGFVPINMFRSILENELKIKEKIVIDFITNMRPTDGQQQLQTLDVNLFSHSLRSHIDYVVLVRRLAHYFEIRGTAQVTTERVNTQMSSEEDVTLRIDIESAMRLKNVWNELEAPSTFVSLRMPYKGCQPNQLQTQTVVRSSYPAWHLINQHVKFALNNETLRHIIEYPLEFEVYSVESHRDRNSSQLLGVAYVDLSQMVYIDGVHQLGGYFHIVNKDKFKDGLTLSLLDPYQLSAESLGQIKLGITTNTNFRGIIAQNPQAIATVRENSPVNQRPKLVLNTFSPMRGQSHTMQNLEYSFKQTGLELLDKPEAELKNTLYERMSELDEITRSMRLRVFNDDTNNYNDDGPANPRDMFQNDFQMRIGHGQESTLRSSFQPFNYHNLSKMQQQQTVSTPSYFAPMQVIQDYPNMEDSFNRDRQDEMHQMMRMSNPMNVFENNHSQTSSNQEDLQQQRLEDLSQLNRLIEEEREKVLQGTFSGYPGGGAVLSHPMLIQPNFDGENEEEDYQNRASNIFSPENEERKQRQRIEEEEEDEDVEKLKRIQRILNGQIGK